MLPFFKFVDIPEIPEELIESIESIESRTDPSTRKKKLRRNEFCGFDLLPIKQNLEDWINIYFPFEKEVCYSIFYTAMPMHSDASRISSYNYILRSGGNIVTKFQNGEIEISEHMPLKKWYWMDTKLKHGTIGDYEQSRIILMVTPKEQIIV